MPSSFRRLPVRAASVAVAAALLLSGCSREREEIAEELKSARPELRAKGLARLAALREPNDLGTVMGRVDDASVLVRREAAKALVQFKDEPRVVDALGQLLGDADPEVQAEAARGLAAVGGDKATAYIYAAFSRRGPAVRAAIAEAFSAGPQLQEAIRREADQSWQRALSALESGQAAERVGAAELLGRSGRPEAVEKLVPLLGNDLILLAAGSARGLGFAGDPKAVPALMAVFKENYPALREAAAQALGELRDPMARETLAQVATGADGAAPDASEALTRLPPSTETTTALCNVVVAGAQPAAILVAAKAAGARGGCPMEIAAARVGKGPVESRLGLTALSALPDAKAATPALLARITPLLDDKEPAVAHAAIDALAALGGKTAVEAVGSRFQRDGKAWLDASRKWHPESLPRKYAEGMPHEDSVSDIQHEESQKLDALTAKVAKVTAEKRRAMGLEARDTVDETPPELAPDPKPIAPERLAVLCAAAGRLAVPEASTLLATLAGDPDTTVADAAVLGLAHLGPELAAVPLGRRAATLSVEGLARIADALSAHGAKAEPVLTALLASRATGRGAVVHALAAIDAKGSAEAIEKVLIGSGGDEGAMAAEALGVLGQERSIPALIAVLSDARSPAQPAALQALARLKAGQAVAAVRRALMSDRPEVRVAAVEALAKLGAAADARELTALRADYERSVRRAVDGVLGGGQR